MKKIVFLTTLLMLIIVSCASKHEGEQKPTLASNLINITNNEDKGIKEVIAFYGGQCEYGITRETGDDKNSFWLKFSNSETMEMFKEKPEIPVSNMAYLFYKNLKEEKSNYLNIQAEAIFNGGVNKKMSYPVVQLAKVEAKMKLYNKITDIIRSKDWTELKKYLVVDPSLIPYNKDSLIAIVKSTEVEFGNASSVIPLGFRFFTTKNKQMLHLSGFIMRGKKQSAFSINVDPDNEREEINSLDYDL